MIQVHPDPNAATILAERYGRLDPHEGHTFHPAPGCAHDPDHARARVQTHGRTWQLVQLHATVQHGDRTGQAVVSGVEDDRPLQCVAAQLRVLEDAERDAEDWALLGL